VISKELLIFVTTLLARIQPFKNIETPAFLNGWMRAFLLAEIDGNFR
jgi:hypothetical protein